MSDPSWDQAWRTDDPSQYWADAWADAALQVDDLKAKLAVFANLYQPHLYGKFDDHPVFAINDAMITVGNLRDAVIAVKGSL